MSLEDFLSQPSGRFEVVPGFAETFPNIRVGGLVQPAVWLGQYALPNEPIIVGVIVKPDAPAQCLVLGRVGGPLPVEGIVSAAPPGSDTITVTADTIDYTVTFAADLTPTVGDRMRLLWQGGTGTAVCKVGVTPAVNPVLPSTPPPPAAATSGVLPITAIDSATYSSGYGWNSYYSQNLYQGNGSTWGAPASNAGAWFYGTAAAQLTGATVPPGSSILLRVPARKSGGASGSAVTLHIYAHTSANRPGGDVSRVVGPFDISIPAGYTPESHKFSPDLPPGWLALPSTFNATILAGGGLSITGDPYMGVKGRAEDPESGQLQIPWQR